MILLKKGERYSICGRRSAKNRDIRGFRYKIDNPPYRNIFHVEKVMAQPRRRVFAWLSDISQSDDKHSLCRYTLDEKNEKCAARFCCRYIHLSPEKHHKHLRPLDRQNSLHSCAVTIKARYASGDRCIDHSQHRMETNLMSGIQIACSNQVLASKL